MTDEVGQFKVATEPGGGFYAAGLAGLLGFGLVFSVPLPLPKRRRTHDGVGRHAIAPHRMDTRVVVLALAGLGASRATRAPAAELVVGGAQPSITHTLAAAHDGDTVIVPSGVYREHLTVTTRVRLVGRPGAVIDGDNDGTVLRIAAPGVEVRGLTVRNSGATYNTEDAGIRIDHAADVRIVDTKVTDTLFGIFVVNGDHCDIEDSTVIGKDLPEVRRGDSIRLWYSSGCRLIGNHIERSRDLVIWYSANTAVEDNVVLGPVGVFGLDQFGPVGLTVLLLGVLVATAATPFAVGYVLFRRMPVT